MGALLRHIADAARCAAHTLLRPSLASLTIRWLTLTTALLLVWGSLPHAAPEVAQAAPAAAVSGLHVVGNQILNGAGQPVRLRGVQRLSGEYGCIFNFAIFEGPTSDTAIQAMRNWKVNVVRMPLNEDCWLDVNTAGIDRQYVGAPYRAAVTDYITRLTAAGIAVIVDLHWSAPGTQKATGQTPMANRDHSVAFWSSVADAFKTNTAVIFDLFNEPYPDDNRDTTAAWACVRDGTTGAGSCPGVGYEAAGMQELLNAVRATGATNLVMVAGVAYTGVLSRWIEYRPTDTLSPPNIAASVHIYPPYSQCSSVACWDQYLAPLTEQYPLIAGEIGQSNCAHDRIDTVIDWLEARQQHYVVHAWWTEPCGSAAYYGLITDYLTGAPSVGYGQGYKDRLATLVGTPAATPTTAPTRTFTPTATSTATSVATATATRTPTRTPTPSTSYVASATAAPNTVAPGGSVAITGSVTSASARTLVVDIEVHDAIDTVLHQTYYENVVFSAGQTRTFPATWNVPAGLAPGTYTVQVGVFSQNWGTMHLWNSYAAYVTVATTTATNTPTPTLTATATPTRTATATPTPTATPTSTLIPIACSPRPPLRVDTRAAGSGLLEATVSTTALPGPGQNALQTVTFGAIQNGSVTLNGQPAAPGEAVPLGNAGSVTIVVQRAVPGQHTTVPLTVRDRCGDWTTFVGGGPTAF